MVVILIFGYFSFCFFLWKRFLLWFGLFRKEFIYKMSFGEIKMGRMFNFFSLFVLKF